MKVDEDGIVHLIHYLHVSMSPCIYPCKYSSSQPRIYISKAVANTIKPVFNQSRSAKTQAYSQNVSKFCSKYQACSSDVVEGRRVCDP